MTVGRYEVETTVNAVVFYILTIQAGLLDEVLVELLIYVAFDGLPAMHNVKTDFVINYGVFDDICLSNCYTDFYST